MSDLLSDIFALKIDIYSLDGVACQHKKLWTYNISCACYWTFNHLQLVFNPHVV